MSQALVVRGNALNLPMPDASVDLVITSPPYFALRSYRDEGEHYEGQIGSEPTPKEFLEALWAATREMVRVLKPTGSIWVNLGDKYAGSGGHNNSGISDKSTLRGNGHTGGVGKAGPQKIKSTLRSAPDRYNQNADGIRTKSLMGLPWRYAIGCIDDLGLILRAEVVWSKVNSLPESVQDRVRRSHEQWFHFTREPRYFAAVDEIRSVSNTAGGTSSAPLGCSTLRPETRATICTDDGAFDGWGWCDLSETQVPVVSAMASVTKGLQVIELVGLDVGIKSPERNLVVDFKMVGPGSPIRALTDGAEVSVALQRLGALLPPVGASVLASASAPSGALLSYSGAPPSSVALRRAKAKRFEVAFSPSYGVAACITLTSEQGEASLFVWNTLASAHEDSLPPRSDSLGKLPGSVWTIPSEPLIVPEWARTKYNLPDHFAAFPQEWPRRIILGWSPSGVCVECGEGRRPVVDKSLTFVQKSFHSRRKHVIGAGPESPNHIPGYSEATITGYACACTPYTDHPGTPSPERSAAQRGDPVVGRSKKPAGNFMERVGPNREYHIDDWTPPETKPAVVLDPFSGTGTVVGVAKALGRIGVGVDLSHDYSRLGLWRVRESGHFSKSMARTNLERQGSLL